eukprot:3170250-Pyramimonas_sp.AAC.1
MGGAPAPPSPRGPGLLRWARRFRLPPPSQDPQLSPQNSAPPSPACIHPSSRLPGRADSLADPTTVRAEGCCGHAVCRARSGWRRSSVRCARAGACAAPAP